MTKSSDELFELLNIIVPGVRDLQQPLDKTLTKIWPLIKKDIKIVKKQMSTIKDIVTAINDNEEIDDEEFAKWGKSLLKSGGPHYKKWVKALQSSPLQDLVNKIQLLNLDNLEEILDGNQMEVVKEIVAWTHTMFLLLVDMAEFETKHDNPNLFDGIVENFKWELDTTF